jgi:hypothetical protein
VQTQKWNGRQLNGRVTKSEEMIRVLAAVAESTSGAVANESVSTPEVVVRILVYLPEDMTSTEITTECSLSHVSIGKQSVGRGFINFVSEPLLL